MIVMQWKLASVLVHLMPPHPPYIYTHIRTIGANFVAKYTRVGGTIPQTTYSEEFKDTQMQHKYRNNPNII